MLRRKFPMIVDARYPDLAISNGVVRCINDTLTGDLIIPEILAGQTVKAIAVSGFENCKQLTSVTIPSTVKRIGHHAFCCCSNLQTVNLPESLEQIQLCTFDSCCMI